MRVFKSTSLADQVFEKLENDIIGEEFRQLLDLFMSAAGRKEKCRK